MKEAYVSSYSRTLSTNSVLKRSQRGNQLIVEMEPEMVEIVKGSKTRAQAMVDAAIKAASSVKEGEDAIKMIQEALDMVGKHQQPLCSSMVINEEHANGSSIEHHQNQSPSDASKPMMANNDFISQDGSEKNEAQMPSELITSCVASWLMIQALNLGPVQLSHLQKPKITRAKSKTRENENV